MRRFARCIIVLLVLSGAMAAQDRRLTLGAGDLVAVDVFNVPELKQEVRVNDQGDAEFALVGSLHVAGMTIEQTEQQLCERLQSRQLVTHPQVSLTVREYATQGVAVSGEVRKPGVYAVLGPRTLLQVIAEAGGLTEIASPNVIVQPHGSQPMTVSAGTKGRANEFFLHPGDAVVVPKAGVAFIVGAVARSGGYVMQDGGELSVAQLIALGGGLLPNARAAKALLVRKTGNTREEREIDLKKILRGKSPDIALQNEDILFVPNSAWRDAASRLGNITQLTVGAAIYSSLN